MQYYNILNHNVFIWILEYSSIKYYLHLLKLNIHTEVVE